MAACTAQAHACKAARTGAAAVLSDACIAAVDASDPAAASAAISAAEQAVAAAVDDAREAGAEVKAAQRAARDAASDAAQKQRAGSYMKQGVDALLQAVAQSRTAVVRHMHVSCVKDCTYVV